MAQEVFDEEMLKDGDRPMIYDGGNIRIIKFDNMNLATVIHKDNVIAKRGENKGESRSKWEVLGFHSELKHAFKQVLQSKLSSSMIDVDGAAESILERIAQCEKEVCTAISKIPEMALLK